MKSDREPRPPLISGAEQDVMTSWRKLYCYTQRAGVTDAIKRAYRRRERRMAKSDLRRNEESDVSGP